MIVGLGCVAFVLVAALKLPAKRTYTSSAMFMASQGREASGVSGLAAQFGIAVPGMDPTKSTDFYLELLKSRRILGAVVDSPLTIVGPAGRRRASVADLLDVKEPQRAKRRVEAIAALRAAIKATASAKTGAIDLSVKAATPEVAAALTSSVLDEIGRFNQERRQQSATAERAFIEDRLAHGRLELRQAENRLQGFLESNRQWRTSPQLTFEQDRLSRELAMRQQITTSMEQANEQAKMEQARETPLITVIEPPEVPLTPDPRGLVRDALLGLVAGALLGVFLAFARQLVGGDAAGSNEAQEFAMLRREALDDVKHPWRLLGRLVGRLPRRSEAA
jgi:uncharacterized protein involved in exopolysaccharide biosynthesis